MAACARSRDSAHLHLLQLHGRRVARPKEGEEGPQQLWQGFRAGQLPGSLCSDQ